MSTQVYESYQPSKEIRNNYRLPTINWDKFTRILTQWQQNHLTRKALAELSEEQLKDIGLGREQASVEANKPFWR